MKDSKYRVYKIFYYLSDEAYCTAKYLANQLSVSLHTIKNDIAGMEELSREYGTVIEAKTAFGYKLIVFDRGKYKEARENIRLKFFMNPGGGDMDEIGTRVYDILRIMIIAKGRLSDDDIAERMFVSKNSLKEERKKAKKILESYNLKIDKEAACDTPTVVGNEFDIRMCMVFLYDNNILNENFPEDISNRLFSDYFYYDKDKEYIRKLYSLFGDNFVKANYRMTDTNLRRAVRYTLLSIARIEAGFKMSIQTMESGYLRRFQCYGIASNIARELTNYIHVETDEMEVLGLAKLLIIWQDLDSDMDISVLHPDIYLDTLHLSKEIAHYMDVNFGIPLTCIPAYEQISAAYLFPIVAQVIFMCAGYYRFFDKSNELEYYNPLYCLHIATELNEVFKYSYHITLSEFNIQMLGCMINSLLNRAEYQIRPLKAIICSTYGIEAAKSLTGEILSYIPERYFEKIVPMDRFNIYYYSTKDFDLGIIQQSENAYKHTIPMYPIGLIPTKAELEYIREFVIAESREKKELYKRTIKVNHTIFPDFEFEDKESFFRLICYKLGKDQEGIQKIRESLSERSDLHCIANKICLLFLKSEQIGRDVFELYKLKKTGYWNYREINYIMVTTCRCDSTISGAKFLRDYFHEMIADEAALKELTGDRFYDV